MTSTNLVIYCGQATSDEFASLEIHEGVLHVWDQIHDYTDWGDELEDFSYLDFFLNTYDI
jgi:hypothetical protein